MPTKRLAANADMANLRREAKDLLTDLRRGDMRACQRFRAFHPRFGGFDDAAIAGAIVGQSDAQHAIAREYGFANWPRLLAVLDEGARPGVPLIHNDRIEEGPFSQALDFLDEGNEVLLARQLKAHPGIVVQRVVFEGDNYFTKPTLLEFVAENPVRQGRLPANITAIARIILDAGAKDDRQAVEDTLLLVASGCVAREAGAQIPLLELLCDYGADPAAGLSAALAEGEFDAVNALLARGAPLDLATAAALGLQDDIARLLGGADADALQLALALSALHGRASAVVVLIDAGADPNRYNPDGGHSHCTPLHSAAWAGHLETVKALIAGGARCDIGDVHHNATALGWAEHAGQHAVASYLRALA